MSVYKVIVPKVGSSNEHGTDVKLYVFDEIIEAKELWQKDLMGVFVENGWAIETKIEPVSDLETGDPVRARNDKGHYVSDDESTPDINEAYVSGKTPKKKRKSTKKKRAKKVS
mgnify:CR=1 FL=1